jgi:hypothetical protein
VSGRQILSSWLASQAISSARHTEALRPFRRDEFGKEIAAPSEGHIQAVNALIEKLRGRLLALSSSVNTAATAAIADPSPARLAALTIRKEAAHNAVQSIERVWDFYLELFGQRQGAYGNWLLSCDRIALDCYQVAYLGLGIAKPIPAPPPFCYMRTGFSPATFRRNIPLSRLGRQLNPFPLVQLPYHRLVNPWTLGAVLHEVSHNLQNDLGLAGAVPRRIAARLLRDGHSKAVVATWTRWNREIFADMSGLLLGGPCVVASLMDVVGRSPASTLRFTPRAAHPTPFLRTFISIELLRRMGFPQEAAAFRRTWQALYPNPGAGNIPRLILESAGRAIAGLVDAACFVPYPELGNRSLAQMLRFEQKEQRMIEQAAGRLARGTDPGIVPARFLIGAARVALDRRLAPPGVIAKAFYTELARR